MNIRRIVNAPIAFARAAGFGRSALRRDIDRVENLVLLLAVVIFLVAVPLALLVGLDVRESGTARVATQPVEHQTVAVLLRDAPTTPNSLHTGRDVVLALGSWTTPSGSDRTGLVDAFSGQRTGSTVTIWIDDAGNQVAPPTTTAEVDLGALLTVVTLLVCVLIGIGGGLWLVRVRLNRRRMTGWDADWRATEPGWTKRGR